MSVHASRIVNLIPLLIQHGANIQQIKARLLMHTRRSMYSTRKPTTVDIRSQVHLLSHHTVSLPAPALPVKYILQYAEKNTLLK